MYYSSTANENKRFRKNGFPAYDNVTEDANIHDAVESLSLALHTLESLKEAEVVQLLQAHDQNFPKSGVDFYKLTKRYEKTLIEHALRKTKGSQTKAAKLLNLRLTTLNAMIKRYKISF